MYSHLRPDFSSILLHQVLPPKLCMHFLSLIRVAFPAHTPSSTDRLYLVWSKNHVISSSFNFLHPPVTSSPLGAISLSGPRFRRLSVYAFPFCPSFTTTQNTQNHSYGYGKTRILNRPVVSTPEFNLLFLSNCTVLNSLITSIRLGGQCKYCCWSS